MPLLFLIIPQNTNLESMCLIIQYIHRDKNANLFPSPSEI